MNGSLKLFWLSNFSLFRVIEKIIFRNVLKMFRFFKLKPDGTDV